MAGACVTLAAELLALAVGVVDDLTGLVASFICWSFDPVSNDGFAGTGGAGFRTKAEEASLRGSIEEAKGFEGRVGLRIESSFEILALDRAGSPGPN